MKKYAFVFVLVAVLCLLLPLKVASVPSEYDLMIRKWNIQFVQWNASKWVAEWNTVQDRWRVSAITPIPLYAPYPQSTKPIQPRDETETYYQWDSLEGIWITNYHESQMSVRYEYCDASPVAVSKIYGTIYHAQSFIPQVTHTITSVKLYLSKNGSPTGTLTVEIKATTGEYNVPTGAVLCSGTLSESTITTGLNEITLGDGTLLAVSAIYAIVVHSSGGSSGTCSQWWDMNTGNPYVNGRSYFSGDSGVMWIGDVDIDFIFEEWGYPTQ